MKLDHLDVAIVSATSITSAMPFLVDLGTRMLTGIITAVISAVVLHYVKKFWKAKDD